MHIIHKEKLTRDVSGMYQNKLLLCNYTVYSCECIHYFLQLDVLRVLRSFSVLRYVTFQFRVYLQAKVQFHSVMIKLALDIISRLSLLLSGSHWETESKWTTTVCIWMIVAFRPLPLVPSNIMNNNSIVQTLLCWHFLCR